MYFRTSCPYCGLSTWVDIWLEIEDESERITDAGLKGAIHEHEFVKMISQNMAPDLSTDELKKRLIYGYNIAPSCVDYMVNLVLAYRGVDGVGLRVCSR